MFVVCQQQSTSLNPFQKPTCCPPDGIRTCFFWPIVSKQIWSEALEVFYEHTIFIVAGGVDLFILASSQHHSVRRIRRLQIRLPFGIKHHNKIWTPLRCNEVIKNFESLQNLTMAIRLIVSDDSNYTGTCISYNYEGGERIGTVTRGSRLEGDAWDEKRNWFPVFLRAFQKHQLHPNITRVVLIDINRRSRGNPGWHPKDRRWQQEQYRERLQDDTIQKTRIRELEASMWAVLTGQDVSGLFPDREAEDQELIKRLD